MGSREQLTKSSSDLPKWESHSSCIRYVCNKVIPILRDENAEPEDGLADRQEGSVRPRTRARAASALTQSCSRPGAAQCRGGPWRWAAQKAQPLE